MGSVWNLGPGSAGGSIESYLSCRSIQERAILVLWLEILFDKTTYPIGPSLMQPYSSCAPRLDLPFLGRVAGLPLLFYYGRFEWLDTSKVHQQLLVGHWHAWAATTWKSLTCSDSYFSINDCLANNSLIFQSYVAILKSIPTVNFVAIGISVICIGILLAYDFVIKPWIRKKCKFPIPIQVSKPEVFFS